MEIFQDDVDNTFSSSIYDSIVIPFFSHQKSFSPQDALAIELSSKFYFILTPALSSPFFIVNTQKKI